MTYTLHKEQNMKGFSKEQIISAVGLAQDMALEHTQAFLTKNGDRDLCGFAWVTVKGVRSNSKEGKALCEAGFSKSYTGGLQLWNPSGHPTQSITAKEMGAQAFVEYFRARFPEVEVYADSRLD
jgi:hypothetical protein